MNPQLRKGSTVLLILNAVKNQPKYGYQIMQEIETSSDGYFTMTAALLYPHLHNLEKEGLLTSQWHQEKGQRRRKYYTITDEGQQTLIDRQKDWQQFFKNLFTTLDWQSGEAS